MKQFNKFLTVILIVLVILLFTWPLIIAEIWNVGAGNKPIIRVMAETIVDTIKNGKNYDKYLNEYIEYKFGEAVASKLKISTGGRADTDKYSYRVRFDEILDSNFVVYVYSTGGCYDNLSEVLSKDQKFQHLYSEWVKKQVGIEDENVELVVGFKQGNIDFKNIKKISNNYNEIFESIKNPGYIYIYVKNIKDINDENYESYFYDIKDKYSKSGIVRAENFIMTLYNYDTKLYNNDNDYGVPYINSSNNISYSVSYYNNAIHYVNCTNVDKQEKLWDWRLKK